MSVVGTSSIGSNSPENASSELWFNQKDVRRHLEALGYGDIRSDVLEKFSKDLERLVSEEEASTLAKSSPETSSLSSSVPRPFCDGPLENESRSSSDVTIPKQKTRKAVFSMVVDESQENRRSVPGMKSVPLGIGIQGDASFVSIEESLNEGTKSRRRCTRKVFRKKNESRESLSEMSTNISHDESDEMEWKEVTSRPHSALARVSSSHSHPPSFIRPVNDAKLPGRIRRCDPVQLYHGYREQWLQCPLPGESYRSTLRWNIRENIMKGGVLPLQHQRVLSPNEYVPPPDKKRQSLRWAVRQALANH